MTTTTTVPATNILSLSEAQKLETSKCDLLNKYRLNGCVLNEELITPILGKSPIIPDSPDMDARMDAWEELAEYGRKIEFIEGFLMKELR